MMETRTAIGSMDEKLQSMNANVKGNLQQLEAAHQANLEISRQASTTMIADVKARVDGLFSESSLTPCSLHSLKWFLEKSWWQV